MNRIFQIVIGVIAVVIAGFLLRPLMRIIDSSDTARLVAAIVAIVVLIAVLIIVLVMKKRRERVGMGILTNHPEAARIYTRLTSFSAEIYDTFRLRGSVVEIKKVDGSLGAIVEDNTGRFTPILPGIHVLDLTVTVRRDSDIIKVQFELELEPYQCIYLGFDDVENTFAIDELGYTNEIFQPVG